MSTQREGWERAMWINYSTTFINTGIFTVHSLLVAVTILNGRGGDRVILSLVFFLKKGDGEGPGQIGLVEMRGEIN